MHFRYSPKSRRKFDALAFAALCQEPTFHGSPGALRIRGSQTFRR